MATAEAAEAARRAAQHAEEERIRNVPHPFVVGLPPINGQLYIGLSAVGDQRLAANKLLIYVPHSNHETSAMLSALATVKGWPARAVGISHKILFNSAYAAIYFGLTRDLLKYNHDEEAWHVQDKGQAGGEFIEQSITAAAITQDEYNSYKPLSDKEWVSKTVTAMLATKINWWAMNHHYGQGGPSPFMAKVLRMLYPEVDQEEYADVTYCSGHWISTHFCLELLGIKTGRRTEALSAGAHEVSVNLEITDDFMIRMDGLPAGVAKHAMCHAFLRKYSAIPVIAMIPRPLELRACYVEVERLFQQTRDFKRYGFWTETASEMEGWVGGEDPEPMSEEDIADLPGPSGRGKRKRTVSTYTLPETPTKRAKGKAPLAKKAIEAEKPKEAREKHARERETESIFARVRDRLDARYKIDPRIFYHMGATFIHGLGEARRQFMSMEQTGIVGSILSNLFPSHTQTKSPMIGGANTGSGQKKPYEQSESHSPAFETLMQSVAVAPLQLDANQAKLLVYGSSGKIIDQESYVWFQAQAGVNEDEALRAYQHISDVAEGKVDEGTGQSDDSSVKQMLAALLAVQKGGATQGSAGAVPEATAPTAPEKPGPSAPKK